MPGMFARLRHQLTRSLLDKTRVSSGLCRTRVMPSAFTQPARLMRRATHLSRCRLFILDSTGSQKFVPIESWVVHSKHRCHVVGEITQQQSLLVVDGDVITIPYDKGNQSIVLFNHLHSPLPCVLCLVLCPCGACASCQPDSCGAHACRCLPECERQVLARPAQSPIVQVQVCCSLLLSSSVNSISLSSSFAISSNDFPTSFATAASKSQKLM